MISIGTIIAEERKKNKLSQSRLADELKAYGIHVTQKAISKWEINATEPNTSQFLALCRILKITDIYGRFVGHHLDDPFFYLNDKGKDKALEYIDLLQLSDQYKTVDTPSIQKYIFKKIYQLPVSAGTGEFLDSDAFDEVEFQESMVPDGSDFGVRIHGDSMEPQFVNGQIVWVHQQPDLHSGEIGIFYLNGNAYCKRLYKGTDASVSLVSLNPSYKPIIITAESDFRVYGKVL